MAGMALLCLIGMGCNRTFAHDCPDSIRVAYTDVALTPYIMGEGPEFLNPPGLFVTWSRNALQKLGCQQAVSEARLPYNRIVTSMANGGIDIRVTGAYREDVLAFMVFPMAGDTTNRSLAVAEAATALYVRKQEPLLTWDGKALQFTGKFPTIGAVRGHYTEKLARARNWNIDAAPSWESNVRKLLTGRVAAIVGPDSVVEALDGYEQLQRLDPPLAVDLYYAPVSRHFYDKYPAFARQFWFEICQESRTRFRTLPKCSTH